MQCGRWRRSRGSGTRRWRRSAWPAWSARPAGSTWSTGSAGSAGSAEWRSRRRILGLVRGGHDIGADRLGVLRRDHLGEGRHAVVLQCAADDDGLEGIGTPECAGVAAIREQPAHRAAAGLVVAVASSAVRGVLLVTQLMLGGVAEIRRRIERWRRE